MMSEAIAVHVRGHHPRADAIRTHLHDVCSWFLDSGLADPKFAAELSSGSDQKFWSCMSEALVGNKLRGKNFAERRKIGLGPDFVVTQGNQRIWVEVVCPQPVDLQSGWLQPAHSEVINFPHEQILLRWTSVIARKVEDLMGSSGYLASGIVAPGDAYVIAVNGCRLRSGPFPALMGISQFPFAAEAVFPIGPYEVKLDRDTFNIVDQGHQHRPALVKPNASKVPLLTFTDPAYAAVSAIWAVDFNGASAIGNSEPAVVIHNPHAVNPIPIGFLPADHEYVAVRDGDHLVISRVEPTRPSP